MWNKFLPEDAGLTITIVALVVFAFAVIKIFLPLFKEMRVPWY